MQLVFNFFIFLYLQRSNSVKERQEIKDDKSANICGVNFQREYSGNVFLQVTLDADSYGVKQIARRPGGLE